jgi:hypothetical protein
VAFDLHHVLMRPNYRKMAQVVLTHPEKTKLLRLLSSPSRLKVFVKGITSTVPEKKVADLAARLQDDDGAAARVVEESLGPAVARICNAQECVTGLSSSSLFLSERTSAFALESFESALADLRTLFLSLSRSLSSLHSPSSLCLLSFFLYLFIYISLSLSFSLSVYPSIFLYI